MTWRCAVAGRWSPLVVVGMCGVAAILVGTSSSTLAAPGRPSLGQVGAGGARAPQQRPGGARPAPTMGNAGRPMPSAMQRPAPMQRPATPSARPAGGAAGPAGQVAGRPALPPQLNQMMRPAPRPAGGQPMQRPAPGGGMPGNATAMQRPSFQRPSGNLGAPNVARPSLPSAINRLPTRPAPGAPTAGLTRPAPQQAQATTRPSPQQPTTRPSPSLPYQPMTRPAPAPGGLAGSQRPTFQTRPGVGSIRPPTGVDGAGPRPGGGPDTAGLPGLGGSLTRPSSRPGSGFATRPSPSFRPDGLGRPDVAVPGVGGRPGGVGTRPAADGGRPGVGDLAGGGNRPGIGGGRPEGMTRPTPGFERPVGGGGRPDVGGTLPGAGTRPGLGGDRPALGGNRPGIGGGNRPGIGMTKPAPGFERPFGGGDRPWLGGNRPGGNRPWDRPDGWNRPGIGGNRPSIGGDFWNNVGNDNSINTSVNNWVTNQNWTTHQNWYSNVSNTQVGVGRPWGGWGYGGGGWGYGGGYGGWGLGGWGNQWQSTYVNPGYGWYNGCWNSGWGSNWWTPFALGAATTGLLTTAVNWGLGSGLLGYTNGYANPYYTSVPATVVAASPYDYSQPIVVNNYIPVETPTTVVADAPVPVTPLAEAAQPPQPDTSGLTDEALAAFRRRDYETALAKLDRAVQRSPGDTVLHEVRGLCLFALGRYPEAAAVLNAVLAVAPGMDWTTLSGLYDDVDEYTRQLRNLEAACRAEPTSAANHFVLAYHYLVGGHADLAADALEVVVKQQPGDAVSRRLLDALEPAEPSAPAAGEDDAVAPADGATKAEPKDGAEAAPETDLVGRWKAVMGDDAIELVVAEDFTFTWKAVPKGKPAVELTGTLSTTADIIALESEKAGTMVAKVKSQGPDAFEFSLAGAPKDAPPLRFERQQ